MREHGKVCNAFVRGVYDVHVCNMGLTHTLKVCILFFCRAECWGPGENVREMLPSPLHRGQQQLPGQLLLGRLWSQRDQGAGPALPGLQVFFRRGDARGNDVRFCGHELQRLHLKNSPNQVRRKGDGRLKKKHTDAGKHADGLCPSALIQTDHHLSWCWARSSQPGQEEVRTAASTRKPSPTRASIPLSRFESYILAAGYKTAWSSSGRTATRSGLIRTPGSTVF